MLQSPTMSLFTSTQEQQICQVMRSCGLQAAQMAVQSFDIAQKGPDDYVTSVDRLLDQTLAQAFSRLFPEADIITEENLESRRYFGARGQQCWCIDPLDGTWDFIEGQDNYAVMAGLLEREQPIAGWVYAPAQDRLYYGGRNWGLFQMTADYPPMALLAIAPVPPTSHTVPMLLGHHDYARFGAAIKQHIPTAHFYSIGSFGLKVLEVIQGRAGLYPYCNGRVKVWDTAAPLALAQAAGLMCCELNGQPIRFSRHTIDPTSLAHREPIVIGWPDYIDAFLPKLQQAVQGVLQEA